MSISDSVIQGAVTRYYREYDRYLKLCVRVAEICRLEIVEGNAIRAQVTSRAKSPKSLEGKLRRFAVSGKKEFPDIDSVFDQIRDLAAVRIATYEQKHEKQIAEEVCKRFAGHDGENATLEVKDRHAENPSHFYRATHCEVFLPATELVGTYVNVSGVPCEVQVCSMMAHVWNEIEHDLGYKPLSGELSTLEKELLVSLGHLSRSGDGTISQLLAATDQRQTEQTDSFADVYDFVARVRRWFPGTDFGRHAGQLFEQLRPLRLITPESLRKAIESPEAAGPAALKQLKELSSTLCERGETRFNLDDNSADLLLVALLPRIAKHLVKGQQPDGSGGATRIRWIAERFLEIEESRTKQGSDASTS
jgi:ppGpp synthetase/RelA/SpoT-type nucleotidyltranferase